MFWAVVGECRGEARKTTFVWIFSVSRQEEPSSVVKPPPLQRVHVISSQDIHRIYLNKNLQLQMSCDYFSDYLRGFQWCHKRGSSLLSDLRQSSYKLAPFIFIRTNRKDCGPGLSSLSLRSAPALAGLNLHKSGLTVSSLETGAASQPLLYLAFDYFMFLWRKANVFLCFHKTI